MADLKTKIQTLYQTSSKNIYFKFAFGYFVPDLTNKKNSPVRWRVRVLNASNNNEQKNTQNNFATTGSHPLYT